MALTVYDVVELIVIVLTTYTHTKGFKCCDSLLRGSAGLYLQLFVFVHHEARTSLSKEQEITAFLHC